MKLKNEREEEGGEESVVEDGRRMAGCWGMGEEDGGRLPLGAVVRQ